jgi:hypothetical protein
LLLSSISIAATYKSAAVIDEVYLNNQRAKLAFDSYFETGVLPSVAQVNAFEVFHMPNFLNFKRCSFIRFGEREISRVLTDEKKNYYAKSVFLQL